MVSDTGKGTHVCSSAPSDVGSCPRPLAPTPDPAGPPEKGVRCTSLSQGRAGSSGDPVPEGHSPHHTKRGTQPGQCFVQTPAEIPRAGPPGTRATHSPRSESSSTRCGPSSWRPWRSWAGWMRRPRRRPGRRWVDGWSATVRASYPERAVPGWGHGVTVNLHTHIRDEDEAGGGGAHSGKGCGRRWDWKPSLGDPPAALGIGGVAMASGSRVPGPSRGPAEPV